MNYQQMRNNFDAFSLQWQAMRLNAFDAQQAFSFLVSQITYIEPVVYAIQYPDIQYKLLVPVDNSAPEWVKSVTYYSTDKVGQARWFHHEGTDMPRADIQRSKFEVGVEMAGIGYGYTLEELGQAMMIPGFRLTAERADAARRASEEFIEDKAFVGDSAKGWYGLINNTNVSVVNAAGTGTGGSAAWADKTGDQIAFDVNQALSGIYSTTKTVEMADTLLLPIDAMTSIATKRMDASGSPQSVLEWLSRYNVYTQQTGQQLTIRAVRQLENAGVGGDKGRMVVYRRDPQVVKMHIPMPHRFLDAWQTSSIGFDVPGIFRIGGVEIRRPGAFRYVDGISNYAS
jgi:hypothetical protein